MRILLDEILPLDEDGLERLQNYIEEYASESPQNRVKDLARKFGIRDYEGYTTLEAFAYDLSHNVDGSGETQELVDYLTSKNPSSRVRYHQFLSKYEEKSNVVDDEETESKLQTSTKLDAEKVAVKEKQYTPDPAKDTKYFEILKIIQQAGKNMERSSDDNEERLRDELLNVLKTKLDGKSVTAEEYNRKGHTDIKISHNDETLFIAECKIWAGSVNYKKGITQLMSRYLTWRDRHTAVILFVKQKSMQKVLKTIQSDTETHESFDKFIDLKEESWFNFIFQLPHDKQIKIRLAVLVFHVY